MGLSHEDYVTLLPKSITTAIGMGVSEELGGYVTITVAVIVVTGVLGNILGEFVCKIFRITEPISKGLALGASSRDRGGHELSCYRCGRNTYGGVCIGVCKLLLICLSASCALAFLQKGAIFI